MPRLLYVITSLGMGGAEMQVKDLAYRFRSRAWEVMIVTLIGKGALTKELEEHKIQVKSLHLKRRAIWPRGIIPLAGIIREFNPDIVHAHMVHSNILARLARLIRRVPVLVCTAHNIDERGFLRELGYRLTDSLCDMTTQVSEAGLERYRKIKAVSVDRSCFIPNGVELERFFPQAAGKGDLRSRLGFRHGFAWLAVGRFQEQKDYPNMIAAMGLVRPGTGHLCIVGDGPQRSAMEDLVAEKELKDRITFLGMRRDVDQLMKAADGFVLSSAWEGMPIVLLEAAASGLPVVVTDVGGNASLVDHGRTGFLVPPSEPERLAEAMDQMAALPVEEREEMQQQAQRLVRTRYSLDAVWRRWAALYEELYEKRAQRKNDRIPDFRLDIDE